MDQALGSRRQQEGDSPESLFCFVPRPQFSRSHSNESNICSCPGSYSQRVVTGQTMAEIDRLSIQSHGIPSLVLMENAGRAAARRLLELYPQSRFLVLCGPGNNGGDGYVMARTLHVWGYPVKVAEVLPAKSPDCLTQKALWQTWTSQSPVDWQPDQRQSLGDYDVVVDAIFGIGQLRPLGPGVLQALRLAAEKPLVAIDVPSGLDADSGKIQPGCPQAAHTLTFGLTKFGHWLHPGAAHCGQVHLLEIGFPPFLLDAPETVACKTGSAQPWPSGILLGRSWADSSLPARPADSHKGQCGKVLLVAGSERYPGAAILAAKGAIRSGAGLVYLAVPPTLRHTLVGAVPEAIPVDVSDIGQLLPQMGAWAIGPGLGEDFDSAHLLSLIEKFDRPLLLDADGLRLLSGLRPRTGVVLTPHHGELARLLGCSVPEVAEDRLSSLSLACEKLGCTVLLKGKPTLVGSVGVLYLNSSGHRCLSQGGSGDVLTGCIATLMAQGLASPQAAGLGAFLHGRASELCAQAVGPRGVGASQIADYLPKAFGEIEQP